MHGSLILQSRDLIEKLTHKKCQIMQGFNSGNTNSFNELLKDKHNLRKNDHTIFTHRISDSIPKSAVTSILSRSAYLSKSMPKRVPFGIGNYVDEIGASTTKCSNLNSLDLMGYDWIAGMMENKAKETQLDQPQEYFEELERFRRQNKEFCISTVNRQPSNTAYASHNSNYKKAFTDFNYQFQSNNAEDLDKCEVRQPEVYAYTLNERLFPIPLDMDTAQRGVPDPNNPHIIKISIPSNRFVHRNQKIQTMKEKPINHEPQPSDQKLLGESLSLSSHCQLARGNSLSTMTSQTKTTFANKSSHQEPASLRGHILMDSVNGGALMSDAMSPFGGNQPRSQQEAIDQLQRGKTGAKLSRMVPSTLTKRGLNIEPLLDTMNICQTRITLKDMDESQPRSPIKTCVSSRDNDRSMMTDEDHDDPRLSPLVPRASLSRGQMSQVYGNALRTVRDGAL